MRTRYGLMLSISVLERMHATTLFAQIHTPLALVRMPVDRVVRLGPAG